MSEANLDPSKHSRIDTQIGLVLEDQRTTELRQVIYTDSQVVLLRDESGNTTLLRRKTFDAELGTRYRPRPGAEISSDAGQYDRLRERLAAYEREDGRKARHKVDALREALDLLAGESDDDETTADEATDQSGPADVEVPFEEVPGIGPDTAGKLRTAGYVTERDVNTASDDELLAVAGVGPSNLTNIREFLE